VVAERRPRSCTRSPAVAANPQSNAVLETLLLGGNPVGEAGARHLMAAMGANATLHFLGLQGSSLTGGSSGREGEDGGSSPIGAAGRIGLLAVICSREGGLCTCPLTHGLARTLAPSLAPATAAGGASGGGPGRSFNPACPDGAYALDLCAAGERAVAVALAEMDAAVAGADLMRSITLDGRVGAAGAWGWPGARLLNQAGAASGSARALPTAGASTRARDWPVQAVASCKKADWPGQLPARGRLVFEFSSKKAQKTLTTMDAPK
jgi:hypothetical protein